jgi:hypothetical protein
MHEHPEMKIARSSLCKPERCCAGARLLAIAPVARRRLARRGGQDWWYGSSDPAGLGDPVNEQGGSDQYSFSGSAVALADAIALRALGLGAGVIDVLDREVKLVLVPLRVAAELAAAAFGDLITDASKAAPRAPTRRTDGNMSRKSSTHLPCNSAAINDTSAVFPPGRLDGKPNPLLRIARASAEQMMSIGPA